MPLLEGARDAIRANLERIASGQKAPLVAIGRLTEPQLEGINRKRAAESMPPIDAEIVFFGKHIHDSRIVRDGYTIDDVIKQIESGLDAYAQLVGVTPMTALDSPLRRDDGYGNTVLDRVILECSRRHPRPELFSVVPKGDKHKPEKKKPLTCGERLEPQRLARVTTASGAPVAAVNSMAPPEAPSQ